MTARSFAADVYAALKATTKQFIKEGFGHQELAAAATRVEQQAISDYGATSPDKADRFMPVDVMLDLIKASGNTRLLKFIADHCDCLLVPLPTGYAGEVSVRTGRSAKEFGDVMVRVGEALADDGEIDDGEAVSILGEIRELMLELSALAEAVKVAPRRGGEANG